MNSIDPGTMDKRIQIIRIVSSDQDDEGFESMGRREVVHACWSRYSLQSGTEILKSGSVFADTKQRFLIRYPPVEITEDMLVHYQGRDYEISYINSYGDGKQYMELWTERKAKV